MGLLACCRRCRDLFGACRLLAEDAVARVKEHPFYILFTGLSLDLLVEGFANFLF